MSLTQDSLAPQATGTSSDKHRAELYDEMRQKAEELGYGNIIEALTDLARMRANPVAGGLRLAAQWHQGQCAAFRKQMRQDEQNYNEGKAKKLDGSVLEALMSRWGASSTSSANHNYYASEMNRLANAVSEQAYVALQIQPVSMDFTYRHPVTGEEITVTMTRAEIQENLSNELSDKLGEAVCTCQPVGETNVVDCGCTDYLDDFVLLPVPAPKAAGSSLPNRHGVDGGYFGKNLARLIRDFDSQTHDELARTLIRLANVADGSVIRESEFAHAGTTNESFPILWAHRDAFNSSESAHTYHLQSKTSRGPGDIEVMRVSDHFASKQKDSKQ